MTQAPSLLPELGRAISGIHEIADAFDGFIIDQFGVLHDGRQAYPGAADCLRRLKQAGRRLVVLSNSGRRAQDNVARLRRMSFDIDLIDAVVTSGEVAWQALARRPDTFHAELGSACYLIAEDGDTSFTNGLPLRITQNIDQAEFILVVGIDTPRVTLAEYGDVLARARALNLPLLCANNDLSRLTPFGLQPAPGKLAELYEGKGGTVRRYGKPDVAIFRSCIEALSTIAPGRLVMIGDSLEHDVVGAMRAGLASVLVRGGIGAHLTDAQLRDEAVHAQAFPDFLLNAFAW